MEKNVIINFPEEILESLQGTILGEVYQAMKNQSFIDSDSKISDGEKEIGVMIPYEQALRGLILKEREKFTSNKEADFLLKKRINIFELLLYQSINDRLAEEINKYPHLDEVCFRQGFLIVLRESMIKIILMGISYSC